jgi:hypothetical protein
MLNQCQKGNGSNEILAVGEHVGYLDLDSSLLLFLNDEEVYVLEIGLCG